MASTPVAVPFFIGLRESNLHVELKEPLWNKCPSRCCRALSVELNIAEPLLIFDEYGRLDMVKLMVRLFREYSVVGSGFKDVDGEGRVVVGDSGVVGGPSG